MSRLVEQLAACIVTWLNTLFNHPPHTMHTHHIVCRMHDHTPMHHIHVDDIHIHTFRCTATCRTEAAEVTLLLYYSLCDYEQHKYGLFLWCYHQIWNQNER